MGILVVECRRGRYAVFVHDESCLCNLSNWGATGIPNQINEALCKVLCHNLCVVIQSVHELGIETNFSTEEVA
jgi:hypothetical protein